jgi:hypothetical protein
MVKRNKLRHEEDVYWESDGQAINVELTQELRRECEDQVAYAPPPNEDAKWKALVAVGTMPGWNGTMKGVMTCLIQCANFYSGKACPSEDWMAKRLGCDPSSVKRAVRKLKSKYLAVIHRNEPTGSDWKSNAYIIGWTALTNRHEVFPWTDRKHRGATLHSPGGNVAQNAGADSPRKDIEGEDIEGRYEPKRAPSPLALDANVFPSSEGKKEEGIQGEQVEGTEFQHAPSAEPIIPEPDFVEVVEEALSRHPLYLELLGWSGLGLELMMDAAAAERDEAGAGVVLVVERFVAEQKEVGT